MNIEKNKRTNRTIHKQFHKSKKYNTATTSNRGYRLRRDVQRVVPAQANEKREAKKTLIIEYITTDVPTKRKQKLI